ncbi:MAG TPA: GDSL-type esterase/lipase family protein [Opitutaceae bacterium]|jgi:lysophospholipase L1-like esterase
MASNPSWKRTAVRLALALAAGVAALPAVKADDFFIHDGDRVVFLGDSITEQRLYTTYIEAYALTRHPKWNLWFRNTGWGGDTAWLRQRFHTDEAQLFAANEADQEAMIKRSVGYGLDRDVLPLKPTVVTVDFGMNDHLYQAFRPDVYRAFIASQEEIGRLLGDNGSRVAYLTPQPIEDKRPDPDQDVRNISLRKFSDGLRDVAHDEKGLYADEFAPYMQTMLHSAAAIGGGHDAVHPGPAGHTIMAWAILKALGATPMVSTATLDKETGKVDASDGCQIENLKTQGDTVSFDRLDEALPMPVDPRAETALSLIPFTRELNVYELKIVGLPKGQYTVSIDGDSAATVSADDLAQGWNLAYSAGPITEQAQKVLKLIFRKNDAYYARWRLVQLFAVPAWLAHDSQLESVRSAELARLDTEIQGLEEKINAARKPQSRHFLISPVGSGG